MPQIAEYSAPQGLGLNPTETGISAVAGAARRVTALYSEAAESQQSTGKRFGSAIESAGNVATKFVEHQEISHGAVALVGKQAELTQEWNQTAKGADPNDPTVAQKFINERVNPEIDKLKGAFWTEGAQKWAETHTESLRSHLSQKASADMGTLAAAAVSENIKKIGNSLSNTVHADPSSINHSLETIDGIIGGMVDTSPNLDPSHTAAIKKQLGFDMKVQVVRAGVAGMIEKNPDAGLDHLMSGKWKEYISGAEVIQLQKYAKAYKRAGQYDEERAKSLQDKKVQDESTDRMDEVIKDVYGDNPKVTMKDVLSDQTLTQQHREHLIGVLQRQDKPDPLGPKSHATWMDLMGRIRATDDTKLTDDAPIWDEMKKGNLNRTDFKALRDELAQMKTPAGEALSHDRGEFFKRYATTIDTAFGKVGTFTGHSQLGLQRVYEAEMDARRQENVLRAKGIDPHLVYDPRSEHFFGRPENLSRFQPSLQDAVKYDRNLEKTPTRPATTTSRPAATTGARIPEVGEVRDGWRFKGGAPGVQSNWEQIR